MTLPKPSWPQTNGMIDDLLKKFTSKFKINSTVKNTDFNKYLQNLFSEAAILKPLH